MESSIDFDVVVHLGCLKNIDLATRGVYYLELVLFYGKPSNYKKNKKYIKITPVGMFSAPTTIQSNVKGQAIPLAPMLDHSQVDEMNQSFRTRVFVIRYKDEIHELNDGVHWRLTIPNVDLMPLGEGVGPACIDLLHIHVKLMGVSLINDPTVDMYKNVQNLIPSGDLEYKVISEQTLSIQRASSGFHEFFPIRFDRLNFVDLDCMVHCGVTAIRYSIISLNLFYNKNSIRKSRSMDNTVVNESDSSSDKGGKEEKRQLYIPLRKETTNISNMNDERSNLQFLMNRQESKRHASVAQQAAKPMVPSKFDVESDVVPPPAPQVSSDSIDAAETALGKSGLSQLELMQHTNLYFAPLVANYYALISASSNIFKLYMTSMTIGKDENVADNTDETTCILDQKDKIIAELMDLSNMNDVIAVIKERIDLCNLQTCRRWSLLMSALPRIMPLLKQQMVSQYKERINLYWKRQALVHSFANVHRENIFKPHPRDRLNVRILRQEVEKESDLYSLGPSASSLLVRGLPVFDYFLHLRTKKLPYIVLQQYSTDPTLNGYKNSTNVTETAVRGGPLFNVDSDIVSIEDGDMIDLTSYTVTVDDAMNESDTSSTTSTSSSSTSKTSMRDSVSKFMGKPIVSALDVMNNDDEDEEAEEDEEEADATPAPPVVGASLGLDDINDDGRGNTKSVVYKRQRYVVTSSSKGTSTSNNTHLIVLIHGFQGNSYDMRLLANYITVELSDNILVLCAKSNERNNEDSIANMANRLATEIHAFIIDKAPSLLLGVDGKISFFGHSMGGLVARKCLEDSRLKPLIPKFHTFVSLATPHVGTLYAESQLISTGMWALFQYKKCAGLKEIMMEDCNGNIRESAIYKLSKNGVLTSFKHVILVSSPKDSYVPTYSARLQINSKIEKDTSKNGLAIHEMVKNILTPLEPSRLVRITIANNTGENIDVNSIIGRTAHLCYLENPVAVQQLICTLSPYLHL